MKYAPRNARVAALKEQLDGIDSLNSLYWALGETVTLEERAEYNSRQDRLEEIRIELANLEMVRRGEREQSKHNAA